MFSGGALFPKQGLPVDFSLRVCETSKRLPSRQFPSPRLRQLCACAGLSMRDLHFTWRPGARSKTPSRPDYRVYRLCGTLSGVRRTKRKQLLGPTKLVAPLFPRKNQGSYFKKIKNLPCCNFSQFWDPLGVWWHFRGVGDSGENCVRSVFRGGLPERAGEPVHVGRLSEYMFLHSRLKT